MKTIGNLGLLKKEIEKRYQHRIDKVVQEEKTLIQEMKTKSDEIIVALKSTANDKAKKESRISHDTAFNEVMAESKKGFELFSEDKYQEIFDEVIKDSDTVCLGKGFIVWVSSFINDQKLEKPTVRCSPKAVPALKKAIKGKADLIADKKIKGAVIETNGMSYDFTLETLLETKKDYLRRIIADVLAR